MSTSTKSPEPMTTDELRSAEKGAETYDSAGVRWTKNASSDKGAARWTNDGGSWLTTIQLAARGAWKLRPLAEIEEEARAEGLMKPRKTRKAPTKEQVSAALDKLAATSAPTEELGAALSAQTAWDAQSEQDAENVAQKRAQGFVCTFAECVHHTK